MTKKAPLEIPRCFLRKDNGDLFIVWHECNVPTEERWVEISYEAWKTLVYGKEDN